MRQNHFCFRFAVNSKPTLPTQSILSVLSNLLRMLMKFDDLTTFWISWLALEFQVCKTFVPSLVKPTWNLAWSCLFSLYSTSGVNFTLINIFQLVCFGCSTNISFFLSFRCLNILTLMTCAILASYTVKPCLFQRYIKLHILIAQMA